MNTQKLCKIIITCPPNPFPLQLSHAPPLSPHSHHSLRIHQQQVFGLASLLACEHVLARCGTRLAHQKVTVFAQELLGLLAAQRTMKPGLALQLLSQRGHCARHAEGIIKRLCKYGQHVNDET